MREEGEFRVEPTTGPTSRPVQAESSQMAAVHEGANPVRHRRGESLRTLKSHGSSPSTASNISPTFQRPVSRSWPDPRLMGPSQPFVVPVAFLDLDLIVMRANTAFQQLFVGIQDIRGRRLTDIARPTDADNFQPIRNWLREEREMREPAYLPPIMQTGHDPLGPLDDNSLERYTAGFADRQFFWTYRLAGGVEQTLASRVRLGKSTVYFAALTLPPIPQVPTFFGHIQPQSVAQSHSATFGPSAQVHRPFVDTTFTRQPLPQSAPPSPFPQQGYFAPPPQPAGPAFAYPQQQAHYPPPRPSPMHPVAGPSGGTPAGDPFTPQFGQRRLSGSQYPLPPTANVFQPQLSFHSQARPAPPSLPTVAPGHILPSQIRHNLGAHPQGQSPAGLQLPQPHSAFPGQQAFADTATYDRPRRDTLGRIVSGRPLTSEGEGPEDPDQAGPRKRRRMEIETVLQKTQE